jgi:hypothetical protein
VEDDVHVEREPGEPRLIDQLLNVLIDHAHGIPGFILTQAVPCLNPNLKTLRDKS